MLILLGYVAVTTDHEAIRRLNRGRVSSEVSKLSDGRDGERATLFVNVSHDSCEHSTREVFVLSHLARLGFSSESQVGVCGFYGCIDCKETKCHPKQSRSSPFNLSTLFKSLPSPLEVLEARRSVNYQNQLALHESAKLKNGIDGPFLLDLPESTLRQISRFLDPRSLRAFAGTCRYFASISEATIPYLKLKLYPHQVAAVEWMVQREESREMRNPLVHVFSGAAEGLKVDYALNMATKQGSLVPFEDLEDSRGGLFCDEPGLGKTITSLALVLRTQGLRSSPPPGSRILEDGTYMTMEDIDRVESQRFEAIGIHRSTPRSGRRASTDDELVTPKKRRVSRPDFYGGKGPSTLPSPTNSSLGSHGVYTSTATLVVVPSTLVDHWRNQMELHVRPDAFQTLLISGNTAKCPASLLAEMDLVVTTFHRLSIEYQKMRTGDSQLLRVHWLRIILDEGHKLGSIGPTDLKTVCNSLRADRRWVMTGTPTPSTPNSDVRHLFPLLTFIKDPVYGSSSKVWDAGIQRPYEAYIPNGADRLRELLRRIMIRSEKDKIAAIPDLVVRTKKLNLTAYAANQYNEVVEIVQRNLLLAENFNHDKTHSLIRPQNAKQCREALTNLRKSCCLAGHIDLRINEKELLHALREIEREVDGTVQAIDVGVNTDTPGVLYVSPSPTIVGSGVRVADSVVTGQLGKIASKLMDGSNCRVCGYFSRCLILTPCAHLMCTECTEKNRTKCSECGRLYDLDSMGYPEKLIEMQPSYNQSHWKRTYNVTRTAKISYLLERLREIFSVKVWRDGEYRRVFHKVIIFSHYLEHLEMIREQTAPLLEEFFSSTVPEMSDAEKRFLTPAPEALEYYAPTHKAKKDLAMQCFRRKVNRPLLLMDVASALGHDLSFVKYMFIMEPIWDRAMELQVISRAHRLGAKTTVEVEKLVVSETIESFMEEKVDSENSSAFEKEPPMEKQKKKAEERKRKNILMSLKLIKEDKPGAHRATVVEVPRRVQFA